MICHPIHLSSHMGASLRFMRLGIVSRMFLLAEWLWRRLPTGIIMILYTRNDIWDSKKTTIKAMM